MVIEGLRKHKKIIDEWCEKGGAIEYLSDGEWLPVANPSWSIGCTYRIKPMPVKCEPYRRYVFLKEAGKLYPNMIWKHIYDDVYKVDLMLKGFVKWLDEDWITEEVEL